MKKHSRSFLAGLNAHAAVKKAGGNQQVERLDACIPMLIWKNVFSEVFRASADGKLVEIMSSTACECFLRHASVHLSATLSNRIPADIDVNLPDNEGDTALIHAARGGHDSTVSALLGRQDLDVNFSNKEGSTALILAAKGGHAAALTAVVAALLGRPDLNVNVADKDGNTALMLAARGGHKPTVEALLGRPDLDVNVADKDGNTALLLAARESHDSTVAALLGRTDLDVNVVNKDGNTALIRAAHDGRDSMVTALLGRPDLDVNAADKFGDTALIRAAKEGRAAVVSALLGRTELAVNVADRHGNTALTIAAGFSGKKAVATIPICKGLLRKDPRVIACDAWARYLAKQSEGQTTVMWAVGLNDLELVEMVLKLPGADPSARRKDGKSARDMSM